MQVLIIGSGGREHALAWKAAQSPMVEMVWVAPGNAGTALEAKVNNVNLAVNDHAGLIHFAQSQAIGLTIVGPEVPLAAGLVDDFQAEGLHCFGPVAAAAQLEASKDFCKAFMQQHGIPTADYQSFTDIAQAESYLQTHAMPVVIKADGLAAGKGVVIADTLDDAVQAVRSMLAGNAFGEAGHRVVIEAFLSGEEASFIVMSDGKNILPLATSQDHKARDNGDQGPNTGGMGAYSPAPLVTPELHEQVMRRVIQPVIDGMQAAGTPYVGFLYAGLMISSEGEARVLEFNCRFGDPETQPILFRLNSDLVALCQAACLGKLDSMQAEWDPRPALGVVMAAQGYPDSYPKDDVILSTPPREDDSHKVFHAGTRWQDDKVLTSGGRVLCVCAKGDTLKQAQQRAYEQVTNCAWPNAYWRTDIGFKAL